MFVLSVLVLYADGSSNFTNSTNQLNNSTISMSKCCRGRPNKAHSEDTTLTSSSRNSTNGGSKNNDKKSIKVLTSGEIHRQRIIVSFPGKNPLTKLFSRRVFSSFEIFEWLKYVIH